MNYEAEISEMKGDISQLQQDVAEIKAIQPTLQKTLERNVEAHEKLVDTLHEIDKSMVSIRNRLESQSKDIESIKIEMDRTQQNFNDKICCVEQKINAIDEDGKFNIRAFLKNYFPWIVIGVGIIGLLVSNYVKF